jgi:hypothetical protein
MSLGLTAATWAAIGVAVTAAGVSYSIYAQENAPAAKLPTTQRQRSNQIETKLIPALQKKVQAEQQKRSPDRDFIKKTLQDIQDLQDEDALLLQSLGDAHAQAQGISGKDVSVQGATSPAKSQPKFSANQIALAGGAIVAVSIIGVAKLIQSRKRNG